MDGISSVNFSPTEPQFLLVTSWDKSVRLYDVVQNQLRVKFEHSASVLDASFSDGAHAFSGGLDSRVRMLDFNTSKETELGKHDDAVRCMVWNTTTNSLITGSWDASIRQWDPRSPEALKCTSVQPSKIFSMSLSGNMLVVAMAGRHVFIYDVRNLNETVQRRESSLKFMTRCVRGMPNGEGYASSSIEGRVAVEWFDPSPEAQAKKFAFKCHRQTVDGVDNVYPVNALAFHPIYGTFASGGSDGIVNVWDGLSKKRLKQYPRYPSGVASLSFSHDGRMLAVASSYTFEEGEKDHAPDSVFIRWLGENDCRPKATAEKTG